MTPLVLDSTELGPADLPCFIYGLEKGDPASLVAHSQIGELGYLLGLWEPLAIEGLPGIGSYLERATREFSDGNITGANSTVEGALDRAYPLVVEALWPYVEEGFSDPRNSPVPMSILTNVNNAVNKFEDGRIMDGKRGLYRALEEWQSIPEELLPGLFILLLWILGRVFLPTGS